MYEGGPNPTQLQSAPGSSKLPFVMIHDGGGTTFAYFFLGDLKRDVWAIHDPNYFEGEPWAGGIDEMARHYIMLMRSAGIRGRILLGGWSMGGTLALVISRILAEDPTALFTVAGTVLIDTPFHIPTAQLEGEALDPDMSHLPELVQTSFKNCNNYLKTWELPKWTASTKGGKELQLQAGGKPYIIKPGQAIHLPLDGQWKVEDRKAYEHAEAAEKLIAPPPGVILRGVIKTEGPKGAEKDCDIDLFRNEPLLGWSGRYPDFIKATFDIDSAHFDMFDRIKEKRLEQVSDRLAKGLEILDALAKSGQ